MPKRVVLLHCPGDKVYLHDYYTSYSSKASYYWSPTDLVLLSGLLRGSDLRVVDAVAERLAPADAERRVLEFDPDVVVFTTGTATWEGDVRFVAGLRPKTRARLVASSSVFQFEAAAFLETAPAVDAALLDMVSPEILDYVEGRDREWTTIATRTAAGIRVPAAPKPAPEWTIPAPRHDLFPFRENRSPLARRTPFALVVTSIGCPFTCRFCVAGSMAYRRRDLDGVMDELRSLRALGIREVMFNDPTFTVSARRVGELCRRMTEEGLGLSWICNGHVATLDEPLVGAMKTAGCHTIMIGVESAADATLEASSKGSSRERIEAAFAACRRHKVKTLAYFIVGLPGETRESVEATIRFARKLDCDYASFTVLTPDIGSALRAEAIARGRLSAGVRSFDSTEFPVFSSGDLSPEEIWRLRQRAVRAFYLRPRYLLKTLFGIRSLRDAGLLLEQARAMFLK